MQRTRILSLLLFFLPAAPALAGGEVLDQISPASNAWLYCYEPVHVWQQQVRVGLGGRLAAFELRLRGPAGAHVDVRLRVGDGWNVAPVVWAGGHTKADALDEYVVFPVAAANVLLGAGQTFVIEAQGDDSGAEITGNYLDPLLGPPGYPELLHLSGPGCYDNCGWRMGFRTWMITDLSQPYCVSTPNSTGLPATATVAGSFSVAANELVLRASDAPPGQPGMFFYGQGTHALPFGNGVLCVAPGASGLARLPLGTIDAAGQLVTALDLESPPTAGSVITPASTWYFQAWFRDPAGGGASFDLTQGLAISFLP